MSEEDRCIPCELSAGFKMVFSVCVKKNGEKRCITLRDEFMSGGKTLRQIADEVGIDSELRGFLNSVVDMDMKFSDAVAEAV